MQWILQKFEDTQRLADALERLEIPYTIHKVVPFIGELDPPPVIGNRDAVVLFGSYTLWRYAQREHLTPGVFKLRPFVHEEPWHPYLLNGADALFMTLRDVPNHLPKEERDWFMRPVDDSKEEPGRVRATSEIIELARLVLALDEDEIPNGSLRHDTELMLTQPARILKEWRIWVVNDIVQTYSLYRGGTRVVYKAEIDEDAAAFADQMVRVNPGYARAYVMDICRTDSGLKLLETNCINAAGFYAANMLKLAHAIHHIDRD